MYQRCVKQLVFMLYNLRHMSKMFRSVKVHGTLVCAFITSKIDYCNGLLFGLPQSQTMKLQRIQNACARLVSNSSKFCHITPLLKTTALVASKAPYRLLQFWE